MRIFLQDSSFHVSSHIQSKSWKFSCQTLLIPWNRSVCLTYILICTNNTIYILRLSSSFGCWKINRVNEEMCAASESHPTLYTNSYWTSCKMFCYSDSWLTINLFFLRTRSSSWLYLIVYRGWETTFTKLTLVVTVRHLILLVTADRNLNYFKFLLLLL